MKKILLLAAFLLFLETPVLQGASLFSGICSRLGDSCVLASAAKKKAKQRRRNAQKISRELRSIHSLQEKILRNASNPHQVKSCREKIQEKMKEIAPLLKGVKNIPGIKSMTDIKALLKEGRKLVDDPENTSDLTTLETLQKRQLQVVEEYSKGKK